MAIARRLRPFPPMRRTGDGFGNLDEAVLAGQGAMNAATGGPIAIAR